MPRRSNWKHTGPIKVKISKVKRKIRGKTYEQRIIYVPQNFQDVDEAILDTLPKE